MINIVKSSGRKKKTEQDFVDAFYREYCNKINFISHSVRSRTWPDVSFICCLEGKQYYFALETKVYNEYNGANYPKQILSEILINRRCMKNQEVAQKLSYGFLIPCRYDKRCIKPDKIYDDILKYFTQEDWSSFGEIFGCKYVFMYCEDNSKLYYTEWSSFLNYDAWKIDLKSI